MSSLQQILIVDDDPVNLKFLGALLQASGLQVTLAHSGKSALLKVKKELPDLILLDMLMPGLDGLETCRRLKANPKTQDIPVIFLSAVNEVTDKVEAFAVGAADYITKPFQIEEVLVRIKNQLALQSSQAQVRQLSLALENTLDGIARLDLQGRYLSVNQAYADMFGYQPSEMIGMQWQTTIHVDDLAKVLTAYQQMLVKGKAEVEVKGVHKKGAVVYQQLVMTGVQGKQQREIGYYFFLKNITERKWLEQISQAKEQQLSDFVENASIGMYWVDIDGTIQWANQAQLNLLGYCKEEYVGQSIAKFQADRETIDDLLGRLKTNETLHNYQTKLRCKDGSIKYVLIDSNILWQDGQFVHTRCFTRDISDRVQVEETLLKRKQYLRRQQAGLIELSEIPAFYNGDLNGALQALTQKGAHTLNIQRVSVWFYDFARTKIILHNLYELGTGQHSLGVELHKTQYPAYFQALELGEIVATSQAQIDSRTQEFATDYLIPKGITSMLDVPIRSGGQTVGVICHEHVGDPRQWTIEEQNFASYLAYLASLAIESRDRLGAEVALQYRSDTDRLVSSISRAFLDYNLDRAINFTLQALGEFTFSDRCYIFYANESGSQFHLTHQWCDLDIDPLPANRQTVSIKNYPDFYNYLVLGTPFQIQDTKQEGNLTNNPQFKLQLVQSLLNVPMLHSGEIVGFIGLDAVCLNRIWSKEEIDLLNLVGEFIAIAQARHLAELARRQSEERLQLALEGSGDGLWDWNIITGETYFSPRLLEMLGYAGDELEASFDTWKSLIHPEDLPWAIDILNAHLKDDAVPYVFDYRLLTKSGKPKWIANYGKVVGRDGDGNPLRMTGTNRDIDERKQREEVLRNVALGVSAEIGEAFFQSLVKYLTKALGVEYAFIGEIVQPHGKRIRTIAGYGKGEAMTNFEYEIANTPCANPMTAQQLCVYPHDIQQLFPLDPILQAMDAQSYLSAPLVDSRGEILGLLAVVGCQPLPDTRLMEEILKIFMVRVSAELQRLHAEANLQRQSLRSQLFAAIALQIRQSLQLEEILQTTVQGVQKLVDAERVLILRLQSQGYVHIIQEVVEPKWSSVINQGIVDDCLGSEHLQQYVQGWVKSIPDLENAELPGCLVDFLRQFQVKSKLVVPILLQEQLWGMIVVHQCSQPRIWSTFEIDLLEQLANQVGIALAQKQAEKALKQSEERFRSLIENTSDIVILLTEQGVVCYASPSIERLLGYAPEKLVGQNVLGWLHPEDRRKALQTFVKVMRTPETEFCTELRWQELRGDWRVFEAIAKKFEDSTGFVGAIVNARDITERLKLEEIHRHLEADRELNELKLRFFSMASHEFRTPLSTILIAAQVLENSDPEWLDARKLRNIHRIQDNANRMRQLLTDVLIIARIEAQKLDFNPKTLNLRELCCQIVEELKASLAVHVSGIHFSYTGNIRNVCLDEKLLHLILNNLLSNAVKYSPENKEVDFQVTLEASRAKFTIKDRGIGIFLEDRPHLFEAFYRGANVSRIEGTGLGLAIVKKSVDLHGGQIYFDSTVGEGTTVFLQIPC